MSHKVTICLEQLKALEHSTIATALIRTYLQQKNWQPSVSQYIPEHRNRTEQQEIFENVVKIQKRMTSDCIF